LHAPCLIAIKKRTQLKKQAGRRTIQGWAGLNIAQRADRLRPEERKYPGRVPGYRWHIPKEHRGETENEQGERF
jgi:hypothetical protein